MARNKPTPKPLFDVKFDFIDSLNEFVQQVIMLNGAVGSTLELGQVSDKMAPILKERVAALEKAMLPTND